jgi:hypothetical protein
MRARSVDGIWTHLLGSFATHVVISPIHSHTFFFSMNTPPSQRHFPILPDTWPTDWPSDTATKHRTLSPHASSILSSETQVHKTTWPLPLTEDEMIPDPLQERPIIYDQTMEALELQDIQQQLHWWQMRYHQRDRQPLGCSEEAKSILEEEKMHVQSSLQALQMIGNDYYELGSDEEGHSIDANEVVEEIIEEEEEEEEEEMMIEEEMEAGIETDRIAAAQQTASEILHTTPDTLQTLNTIMLEAAHIQLASSRLSRRRTGNVDPQAMRLLNYARTRFNLSEEQAYALLNNYMNSLSGQH